MRGRRRDASVRVLVALAALGAAGCPPVGPDAGVDGGPALWLRWPADRVAEEVAGALPLLEPSLTGAQRWASTPPLRVDEEGTSGPIAIDLTEGDAVLQVLVRSDVDGALVVPTSLLAPDGQAWVLEVVDDPAVGHVIASRGLPDALLSPHRVLGEVTLGSWSFPATPDLRLAPGGWTLSVGAFLPPTEAGERARPAGGTVEVAVLVSTVDDQASVTLPLVVHLALSDLDASTAPTDPVVTEALATLDDVLQGAGVTLAPTTFVDVADPSLRTVALQDDLCAGGDLDALFGDTLQDGAVHVFFVERFSCILSGGDLDVGDQIGGIAGGLPGPGPLAATPQSGIAVATAFADGDGARLGAVLAHEVGHHLGLFHTKERSRFDAPDMFDIIEDTPDNIDDAAANLMYFVAQEDLTLTAGQREVIRRLAWGAKSAD